VLFGGWAPCADALYLRPSHVIGVATGKKVVTGDLAVRLAKALGKPLDALTRSPALADVCPTCGAKRAP
jgi:hypothetical protein